MAVDASSVLIQMKALVVGDEKVQMQYESSDIFRKNLLQTLEGYVR